MPFGEPSASCPACTYEAILVLSRLYNIDTRTGDHLTCSTIALSPFAIFSTTTPRRTLAWAPNHQLRHSHPPSNPHAPRTVHRENHTVYFQPERATTQKQEHRQDTEGRANNAYSEKREGRQRGGGRSGFLCWRPRVRGLPNRGIGSVSHPRGLRARTP